MINRVERVDELVGVRNVLASVADKGGLERLIDGLLAVNPAVRIYSTGGTHARIAEILGSSAGKNLHSVSEYTGQPEMQGGLVKTLDFKIYLGLLSETYNDDHRRDLERTGAVSFDLVVVNLYPFSRAVADPAASCEAARAHIDIGGPCMLRAAAKNFLRVAAVCDPADYGPIIDELEHSDGATSLRQRFRLAQKAFRHTAEYDAAITAYLEGLGESEVLDTYRTEAE